MKEKITKEFLNQEHDELYKKLVTLHEKYNPCGVKKKGDKFTCVAGRDGRNCNQENPHNSFCCKGCQFLGPNGCTIEALRCKLWFCGYIYEKGMDPEAKREFDKLMQEAWVYGFFIFRGTREDNLYNAYYKFGILKSLRLDWIQ